ncbi:hypothetical protein BDV33DRAFT_185227 [Aspergillus novoparasiticus]|uniref:Uncharacterized protein n=1 Tax=Aspergillus novoparasiticus TaxID=986946 RepID=A0A5N6E8R5_9EURO|nr:hypothetical protein BDV33DRAFT_185227 [Aspergillus novoparasiticus]
MPRSVSPSENESSDILAGSLGALSLTEKTVTVHATPAQYNPFAPFLVNEARAPEAIHSIDELMRVVIPQHLAGLQRCRRFQLAESDPLYLQGRQFQERWGVSESSFLNWMELLTGWMEFPAVMLLNPSPWDHLPHAEMVDLSTTLTWLEDTLQMAQLALQDVIIFDMFPMVRDDLLERTDVADRVALVQESFALTVECLRRVQPRVLISCQCCTQPLNARWGFFDNAMAQQLCSSVAGAQSGQVRGVDVGGHRMHVVQGMHPNYIVQKRPDLNGMLQGLFVRVFHGFGVWKSRRQATQGALLGAATVISSLVVTLRRQLQLYQKMCQQAQEFGIEGPVAVGRVEELQSQLDGWEGHLDG